MNTQTAGRGTGNRWAIVLIAVGFNLLFEYALRGINNLRVQPGLPLILFIAYFTYFTMLEDLIVRHRLLDYQLMIASFFFGTVYVCLVAGIAFDKPQAFGLNWSGLLFVNLIWWGPLQAVLTFYLANRLAPRDWNHLRLGGLGWGVMLLLNGLIVVIFQRSGVIPKGTPVGLGTMIVILIVVAVLFRWTLPGASARAVSSAFQKGGVMDLLSALTVFIFLVCAVLLTSDPVRSGASNVNNVSLRIVSGWTVLLALVMLGYRLISKRPIPV